MRETEITLKPRLKKSGEFLKATWYIMEHGCDVTVAEIAEEIKEGAKISFDLSYNGKWKDRFNKEKVLFALVIALEKEKTSLSQDLTRRILNNGGVFNYARELESKLQCLKTSE